MFAYFGKMNRPLFLIALWVLLPCPSHGMLRSYENHQIFTIQRGGQGNRKSLTDQGHTACKRRDWNLNPEGVSWDPSVPKGMTSCTLPGTATGIATWYQSWLTLGSSSLASLLTSCTTWVTASSWASGLFICRMDVTKSLLIEVFGRSSLFVYFTQSLARWVTNAF